MTGSSFIRGSLPDATGERTIELFACAQSVDDHRIHGKDCLSTASFDCDQHVRNKTTSILRTCPGFMDTLISWDDLRNDRLFSTS